MRATMILLALPACPHAIGMHQGTRQAAPSGDARDADLGGRRLQGRCSQAGAWQAAGHVLDCTGCHGENLQGQNVTA